MENINKECSQYHDMDDHATNPVQSVHRTFDIVECLMDLGAAGVTEVAESVDFPVSTAHNYLNTLRERGYVVKEGSDYRLAAQFIHVGDYARHRMELYHVARPSIELITEQTDWGAVNLVVEERGRGIYVMSEAKTNTLQNYRSVRRREYLHSTGAGKAILSELPDDRVEAILDKHGLPRRTANTITDREELLAHLQEAGEQGYAYNDEENTDGIRAVGAPIQRSDGTYASVSFSGTVNRMTEEVFREEVPELVRDAAKSITVDLVSR